MDKVDEVAEEEALSADFLGELSDVAAGTAVGCMPVGSPSFALDAVPVPVTLW